MTAEDRAWEVVRRAYAERVPARRPAGNRLVLGVTVLALGVVLLAAFSPPGHAVFERVRRTVGIEHPAAALAGLPAPGRLLVDSATGTWVVEPDGAKRSVGDWAYASWSPHGRFIIAARRDELAAITPTGTVRWTLARRDIAWPTWEGSEVDTRVAYFASTGLRVVAGDGTNDRLLDRYAQDEPPAWDPARLHTLAYETGGAVVLREVDTGRELWRASVPVYGKLVWSSDGRRLAVVAPSKTIVLDADGKRVRWISRLTGQLLGAAFEPGTHRLAVQVRLSRRSEIELVDIDHPGHARLLFAGPGVFGDIAWSPDGTWLLVSWPSANQWVFLHGGRVHAVANVEQQFGQLPQLGWCCS
ncbi:MAG TPA: PQQ-binding-like beta-propeller repeat protein [Gaiellaceae bacterium]|nr:PQQ-binding-like beta-propeller repeat protein [Gaiellaceae bacterium]